MRPTLRFDVTRPDTAPRRLDLADERLRLEAERNTSCAILEWATAVTALAVLVGLGITGYSLWELGAPWWPLPRTRGEALAVVTELAVWAGLAAFYLAMRSGWSARTGRLESAIRRLVPIQPSRARIVAGWCARDPVVAAYQEAVAQLGRGLVDAEYEALGAWVRECEQIPGPPDTTKKLVP